jgi:hypothetical protein
MGEREVDRLRAVSRDPDNLNAAACVEPESQRVRENVLIVHDKDTHPPIRHRGSLLK